MPSTGTPASALARWGGALGAWVGTTASQTKLPSSTHPNPPGQPRKTSAFSLCYLGYLCGFLVFPDPPTISDRGTPTHPLG